MRTNSEQMTDEDRRSEGLDLSGLRAAIESAVAGRDDIAAAYVYGSVARGEATPLSDLDLGLLFQEPGGDFYNRLAVAMEIGSAVARSVPDRRVEARDLEALPLAVLGPAVTEGILVVSNDESRRVDFERDSRLRYFDFLPIHRGEVAEANAALRERFRRG